MAEIIGYVRVRVDEGFFAIFQHCVI